MNAFPFVIPIVLIASVSCTVKENRQECPCDVTVLTDGSIHEGHTGDLILSVFVSRLSLKTLYREPMNLEDFIEGSNSYQIPKGWFNVSAVGGHIDNMSYVKDTLLLIPCGLQCDSICAFSRDCFAYTDDDDMTVKVPLDKQFCTATFTVRDNAGNDIDAGLSLRGGFDGLNILTLEPHPGVFLYEIPHNDGVNRSARIPRQSDSSLMLEVRVSGNGLETIPIGEMIVKAGYNWGLLSLEDITVDLVYDSMGFKVSVDDWEIKNISL